MVLGYRRTFGIVLVDDMPVVDMVVFRCTLDFHMLAGHKVAAVARIAVAHKVVVEGRIDHLEHHIAVAVAVDHNYVVDRIAGWGDMFVGFRMD